jgi:hypothetical protein
MTDKCEESREQQRPHPTIERGALRGPRTTLNSWTQPRQQLALIKQKTNRRSCEPNYETHRLTSSRRGRLPVGGNSDEVTIERNGSIDPKDSFPAIIRFAFIPVCTML